MTKIIAETCKKIVEAVSPDDIFNKLVDNDRSKVKKLKSLQEEFDKLNGMLAINTSDLEPANLKKIDEARLTLEELYRWAKSKIINEDEPVDGFVDTDSPTQSRPSTGQSKEFKISTRKRNYYITEALTEGDLSTVYRGYYFDDTSPIDAIIKIIRDPADNPFAKREAEALALLHSEPNNEGRQLKHLPKMIDQFTTSDNQRGNVLTYADGYDLTAVRAKYKRGIDRKHMVWILNRLLSVAGYAHSRAVIHGNITPTNTIIRPRDHNLWLIDWSYSITNPAENGARFLVYDEEFNAPEIEKRPELPSRTQCNSQANALYLGALFSTDIYSIGKCMIYILGGNIKTNEMPDVVEAPLQRFIKSFVIESPLQRPRDAWEVHGQLRKIVTQLWGKREFLELRM